MSTFRRRRSATSEHRLDASTLARRIGTLGTALTVTTGLALCAIVENALAPRMPWNSGGRATTPSAALTEAAGTAVSERLGSAARSAYGPAGQGGGDAPEPVVRVSGRDKRRTWAFGASALPAPAGSAVVPEAALFLAHRTGHGWSIGIAGTARFRELLAKVPRGVLPAAQRRALAAYAASRSPGAPAGLGLPWSTGGTWTFAGARARTLAFVRHDGVVRAAGAGRLFHLCRHGLVMIVHANGVATEYAQVDPEIADGAYVAKGAVLGRVEATAPCRDDHAPARLRFAVRDARERLPLNGVHLGAWTLHTGQSRTWATCGGQRVDAGDPIRNEVETPKPHPLIAGPAVSPGPRTSSGSPAASRTARPSVPVPSVPVPSLPRTTPSPAGPASPEVLR